MLSIKEADLVQLAGLLLDRAGLKVGPDGFHSLRLALAARMPALGMSNAHEYVRRLKGLAGEHELRSLLPLVTVGHTEFFRDPRQFRALEQQLLPDLIAQVRKEKRRAQVWSAGCATGEEPFSVAMLLCEIGASPQEAQVWATDLNPAAVEAAQAGRFPEKRLLSMKSDRRRRFFHHEGGAYVAKDNLRAYLTFEGLNLASPVFAHVAPQSWDLILCRNVIIYFDLATIRGLMDRFRTALRPGGYLLLGYSESLFRVYDAFDMVEVEGAFVYRKGARNTSAAEVTPPANKAPAPPPQPLPVRRVPLQPPAIPAAAPATHVPPERTMAGLSSLIETGEFPKALALARALAEDEADLHAILTLGNLCSLMGERAEAKDVFARALQRNPLCVEARVFGGIAAFQAGDLAEARAELSKALFLEPSLALGHYLLAQVEEKAGEHEAARRSYRNAIAQLKMPLRPLAGYYPDLPDSADVISRAARYALSALEER